MNRKINQRLSSTTILATAVLITLTAVALLAAPVAAQEDLAIRLDEYRDSGVTGEATVQADGDGTHVSMQLTGEAVTGNHPTHIHTGTCDNFDPNPTFPLTTVVLDDVNDRGMSETTVEDVSLESLLEGDYVILVHKSSEELTVYLVCGEIKAGAVTTAPVAGIGSSQGQVGGLRLVPLSLAGLAGLCASLAAVSLVLSRRLRRTGC